MAISRIEGDYYYNGNLNAKTMTIPTGIVTKEAIQAGAGIEATKLEQRNRQVYAQESATAASDEAKVVAVIYGSTGTAVHFEAGSVVAAVGDSTVDIDLLRNGSSILNSKITLDNGNTARTPETATISTSSLADGDVLEIDIEATVGTGTLPSGVFVSVVWDEDAQ